MIFLFAQIEVFRINFAILIIDQKKFLKKKFEIAKNLKWNGELEVIKIIQSITHLLS